MKDKRRKARKILDYWYNLTFLEQDVCPFSDEKKDDNKINIDPARYAKKRADSVSLVHHLNHKSNIYSLICEDAEKYNQKTWGNLTFTIGKVKREDCIECLVKELGVKDFESANSNRDEIAIASFRCDQHGIYIEGSFSISPIVWAISKIMHANKSSLSSQISSEQYKADIKSFEKEYFLKNAEINPADLEKVPPIFVESSFDTKRIYELWNILEAKYLNAFSTGIVHDFFLMQYTMYKTPEIYQKVEEETYPTLNTSFYSTDLDMVKNNIDSASDDLIDYICALANMHEDRTRFDLVKENDEDKLYDAFDQILDVKNAPLGKWPSQYQPALMQQVAINLCTTENNSPLLSERKSIFSVNGAPGTGKTTLLKEIIANNVVEKAKLLSQYEKPDDAFSRRRFENAYSDHPSMKYYSCYYSFANSKINDYGILVASNNNAAVENISKELPLKAKLRNELKDNDPEIQAIKQLFLDNENTYFSEEASVLLGNKNSLKKDLAWGLITAPLGKKTNVKNYYYSVVRHISSEINANKTIEENLEKYNEAREEFKKQLKKVLQIREQLIENQQCFYDAVESENIYYDLVDTEESKTEKYKNEISDRKLQLQALNNKIQKSEAAIKDLNTQCNNMQASIAESNKNIELTKRQADAYEVQADQAVSSIGFFAKLFKTRKYKEKINSAAVLRRKKNICLEDLVSQQNYLSSQKSKWAQIDSQKNKKANELKQLQIQKDKIQKNLDSQQEKLNAIKSDINYAKWAMTKAKQVKDQLVEKNKQANAYTRFTPFDEDFFENIISKDESLAVEAQLRNPWITKQFDREREKLFYYALKLTKSFVLASKACRTNLKLLGYYWKTENIKAESTFVDFTDHDRKNLAPCLFQTLFLLTPVISSTFASVGNLLQDLQKGTIGTLIIDEAGQANPQIAVGSLYRANKAIVVGDPKQVEPISKDDLKLLKDVYSESLYDFYKKDFASVQTCADIINPFGTYYNNTLNDPDWVGCPLLVHRRCISPMFDISNTISYGGIMKKKTEMPSKKVEDKLIMDHSQWLQVTGKEEFGRKNHYVPEQGVIVCELIDQAYQKDIKPNVYIISPFTSVVKGISNALKTYFDHNDHLPENSDLDDFIEKNVGTVHKFQGKEANEVILVLGCDMEQSNQYCVNIFVKTNIINVAVTRAKYRLYVVGDYDVWKTNLNVKTMKEMLDQ